MFLIAVLHVKLRFSGFDKVRFHNFFIFRHLHNWSYLNHKGTDYFLKAPTPLSRKVQLNFLQSSLTVVFTFLIVQNFLDYESSQWLFRRNKSAYILIWVDNSWLSWLWKQLFSKIKKDIFLLFSLFVTWSCYLQVIYDIIGVNAMRESSKFNAFKKEFVMNLLASKRVFRKKKEIFFICVTICRRFFS